MNWVSDSVAHPFDNLETFVNRTVGRYGIGTRAGGVRGSPSSSDDSASGAPLAERVSRLRRAIHSHGPVIAISGRMRLAITTITRVGHPKRSPVWISRVHRFATLYPIGADRESVASSAAPEQRSTYTIVRPAGVWSSGYFICTRAGAVRACSMRVVARASGASADA